MSLPIDRAENSFRIQFEMPLEVNGQRFVASEADATIKTLALAARELDEAGYAKWLKENARKK